MRIRSRLRQLERLAKPPPRYRSILQIVGADGTARPTDQEVEAWKSEMEAEGLEPCLIRVRIVNAPREPNQIRS